MISRRHLTLAAGVLPFVTKAVAATPIKLAPLTLRLLVRDFYEAYNTKNWSIIDKMIGEFMQGRSNALGDVPSATLPKASALSDGAIDSKERLMAYLRLRRVGGRQIWSGFENDDAVMTPTGGYVCSFVKAAREDGALWGPRSPEGPAFIHSFWFSASEFGDDHGPKLSAFYEADLVRLGLC